VSKCNSTTQITDPNECSTAGNAKPSQVHIALAGIGEMTVSWATSIKTDSSTCIYGTEFEQQASGTQTFLLLQWHHHVKLTHLKPSVRYNYKCGDHAGGWSEAFSFKTGPDPSMANHKFQDNTPGSFSASVFGDWGYGTNGNAVDTRAALEDLVRPPSNDRAALELIWHLGDIAYADDAFLHDITGFEYENIYNAWMNWIQNMSSAIPYMVAAGNHESECHSPACVATALYREALHNFSAYNTRWRMPFEASGSTSNMWYSFDYGLAHFVSLNTETDFPNAPEEHRGDSGLLPAGGFGTDGEYLAWLEADLAAANASRGTRPWIFAGGHRPVYDDEGAEKAQQAAVEALFQKYGVDVYFSGHKHYYTRSLPVFNSIPEASYVNPSSTVYVVVGGAGCDEMRLDKSLNASTSEATYEHREGYVSERGEIFEAPTNRAVSQRRMASLPDYIAYVDKRHYGVGVLHVLNKTAIRWEYTASDSSLEVLDSFTLTKHAV